MKRYTKRSTTLDLGLTPVVVDKCHADAANCHTKVLIINTGNVISPTATIAGNLVNIIMPVQPTTKAMSPCQTWFGKIMPFLPSKVAHV